VIFSGEFHRHAVYGFVFAVEEFSLCFKYFRHYFGWLMVKFARGSSGHSVTRVAIYELAKSQWEYCARRESARIGCAE
jgi:hypothetical protein